MNLLANVPIWMWDIQTTPLLVWIYDMQGREVSNTKGRVTQQISYNGGKVVITKYQYNKKGQVTSKVTQIGKKSEQTIGYEYYIDGKINKIIYPNETKVVYRYNKNGNLYGIGTGFQPFEYAKYSYGINGKVTHKEYNNNTITSTAKYTLQEHQKSLEILLDKKDGNEPTLLYKGIFKYFGENNTYYNGLVVEKERTGLDLPKTNWKYSYDNRHQLQSVIKEQSGNSQNLDFTYDVNGNLKTYSNSTNSDQNREYTYQLGSNKLNSISGQVNNIGLHTKIGQTPIGNDTRLEYHKLNRKVSRIYAEGNLKELSFTYDANKKRVQKVVKRSAVKIDTLTYTWGIRSLPLFENFTKGKKNDTSYKTWNKVYIYGAEYAPIAMIHKGKTYYFIRDYQSSLHYVINGNTYKVEEKYSYDPFGNVAYSNHSETNQYLGSYLYTGQEYDKEVGLYNFKARLYDPKKRIFLQPDPKHINYSPYTYVGNNPINYTDPEGLMPVFSINLEKTFGKGLSLEVSEQVETTSEYMYRLRARVVNQNKYHDYFEFKTPMETFSSFERGYTKPSSDFLKKHFDFSCHSFASRSYEEGFAIIRDPRPFYEGAFSKVEQVHYSESMVRRGDVVLSFDDFDPNHSVRINTNSFTPSKISRSRYIDKFGYDLPLRQNHPQAFLKNDDVAVYRPFRTNEEINTDLQSIFDEHNKATPFTDDRY